MYVCLSPGGQCLTQGETASDKLLVGTVDGVFPFHKENGSWERDAVHLSGKHASSIIFEPTTETLFVGTYGCEIYASTDQGRTWEKRDSGIGEKEIYSLGEAGQRHRRKGDIFPGHPDGERQTQGLRGHAAGAPLFQR